MAKINSKTAAAGVGVLAIAGLAGAAFAAGNTVPDSSAGQGESTVSGFTVSNIEYETDMDTAVSDPNVEDIRFDIVRDGGSAADVLEANAQVFVQLDGTTYVQCVIPSADKAECDVDGAGVTYNTVEDLNVVAFDTLADA